MDLYEIEKLTIKQRKEDEEKSMEGINCTIAGD